MPSGLQWIVDFWVAIWNLVCSNLPWVALVAFVAAVVGMAGLTRLSWRHRICFVLVASGLPIAFVLMFWSFNPRMFDGHPHLEGRIEVVLVSTVPVPKFASMVVLMSIANRGAMPSIADSWTLRIIADSGEVSGTFLHIPLKGVPAGDLAQGALATYTPKMSLERAGITPIPLGGKVNGALWFSVSGVRDKDLIGNGIVYEVRFRDIEGTEYVAKYKRPMQAAPIPVLPGLE